MFVFIDTNVFYNNWYASNADFKFLFNYLENTDSTLLISELVCQEVENLRNREINLIIDNLEGQLKKAKKLIKTPPTFQFDMLKDQYDFKEILQIKAHKIIFIPYEK